jgi:hypothetical protein
MWFASIELACDVAAVAAKHFSDVQRSLATACSFGCNYGNTVRFAALLLHVQLMVLVGSACSGAFDLSVWLANIEIACDACSGCSSLFQRCAAMVGDGLQFRL